MEPGHWLGSAARSSPTTRAKTGRTAQVFTAQGGTRRANRCENASHRKCDFLRCTSYCKHRSSETVLRPWHRAVHIVGCNKTLGTCAMTTKSLTIKFALSNFCCHGVSQEKQHFWTIFPLCAQCPPSETQSLAAPQTCVALSKVSRFRAQAQRCYRQSRFNEPPIGTRKKTQRTLAHTTLSGHPGHRPSWSGTRAEGFMFLGFRG